MKLTFVDCDCVLCLRKPAHSVPMSLTSPDVIVSWFILTCLAPIWPNTFSFQGNQMCCTISVYLQHFKSFDKITKDSSKKLVWFALLNSDNHLEKGTTEDESDVRNKRSRLYVFVFPVMDIGGFSSLFELAVFPNLTFCGSFVSKEKRALHKFATD